MERPQTARARRLVILAGTGAFLSLGCRSDTVHAPDGELQAPPGGPTTAAAIPQTGLIGNWKLNETGGTVADDNINNLDAIVHGGAAFVPGKIKNALEVDNGPDGLGPKYAEMPTTSPTLNDVQQGTYSISAWFYPYSVPSGSGSSQFWSIVTKYGQHMGLVYNSAQKFVARHYLAGPTLRIANSGTSTYPANAWHHVVGVLDKGAGTLKLYVNGDSVGAETFTPNAAAHEYGTTPFRIGRAETDWAADGIVDQVRIYNVALTPSQIDTLANEEPAGSPPTHPFMVGMTKGQQVGLLGDPPMPDGVMAAQSPVRIDSILDSADRAGARVIIRVTGANGPALEDAAGRLDTTAWKNKFDNAVQGISGNDYFDNGTLVAHYAIDEPINDFEQVRAAHLEALCRHQKKNLDWNRVPCFVRDLNTKLDTIRPTANYTYQWVDAGWAAVADHHYVVKYNNSMRAYFDSNLVVGRRIGLGLMYGFNLLNGGREFNGCDRPESANNCAMTEDEIRELANVLVAIGHDQGCGVSGWTIDAAIGSPERNYYFDLGQYAENDIQGALAYLRNQVSGLRPGVCD